MGPRIGFVGFGQMGRGLADGFIRSGVVASGDIFAHDVAPPSKESIKELGVKAASVSEMMESQTPLDLLFLCVKPGTVKTILSEIAKQQNAAKTALVSICAGVSIKTIQSAAKTKDVIRVMPNLACIVQESSTVYCGGPQCDPAKVALCADLLKGVGVAIPVEEKHFSIVTALSGSGPAFVFMFLQAIADGGVKNGLPRALALQLASQTVQGAVALYQSSDKHLGWWRDAVCSPGGTTIYGVQELEENSFSGIVMQALGVAAERSEELGSLTD